MADITGISALAGLAGDLIERFFPNKAEQEKAQLAAALAIMNQQMSVNLEEAKSTSVFVSGWRPFIGWVCGVACAWNWIGIKLVVFAATLAGYDLTIAPADLTEMWPVLLGMLGLGGLRTYEKLNNVAAK